MVRPLMFFDKNRNILFPNKKVILDEYPEKIFEVVTVNSSNNRCVLVLWNNEEQSNEFVPIYSKDTAWNYRIFNNVKLVEEV